jgi:hypothetical protein
VSATALSAQLESAMKRRPALDRRLSKLGHATTSATLREAARGRRAGVVVADLETNCGIYKEGEP